MRRLGLLLLPLLVAAVVGCARACGKGGAEHERLSVSVSIFPVYDLVRRIAGPDADVGLLVPPGRNEHAFDPAPKDVEAAAKARVGVMVGLGLDPWMEKLMHDAAPKARLLKVGDRVPTLTVKDAPAGDQEPPTDPHVWLDPERARLIVRAIAEELGKADSPHALDYRKRATELDASLAALDAECETRTKALKTRGFVTFHASFGYFAERYKLEIVTVSEPASGASPPRAPVALDAMGGGPETDSYEKIIRFDVGQLEKYLQ